MKLNSNTIVLEKESSEYKELETLITKIAEENKIDDVKEIKIAITDSEGMISFKTSYVQPKDVTVMEIPELELYMDTLKEDAKVNPKDVSAIKKLYEEAKIQLQSLQQKDITKEFGHSFEKPKGFSKEEMLAKYSL